MSYEIWITTSETVNQKIETQFPTYGACIQYLKKLGDEGIKIYNYDIRHVPGSPRFVFQIFQKGNLTWDLWNGKWK